MFGYVERKPFIVQPLTSRLLLPSVLKRVGKNRGFSESTLWMQRSPISLIIV